MWPTRDPPEKKKDLHRLKLKGQKKIFQANGQEKKAEVAILVQTKQTSKQRP